MTVQKCVSVGITNVEDLVELERLSNKILLIKNALGGLLPGLADAEMAQIHDVLEIGCGPGSWTLEMAQTYYSQKIQVTGIDISHSMIANANIQARDRQLEHLVKHFRVDNLVGPFAFPDASFDLISTQFLSKVLFRDAWPDMVGECWRLLRPGGRLRLTDFEVGESNAPAHEELWSLFILAMRLAGRSFSPGDRHLGLLCEMEPMLIDAGFQDTLCFGHMINYSSGAPLHEEWKKDFLILSKGVQPMLVKMGVATQEHVDMLHQQQQIEMGLQNFHGILPMLTVWGRK